MYIVSDYKCYDYSFIVFLPLAMHIVWISQHSEGGMIISIL